MVEKIKIRWKEGAGLFVFLVISGLYFFGIPDFSGVLDYKYAYCEELIGFFSRVILPAPFLVGIFLLSIRKTEKRIEEGRFSFWKLFLFSLAISLAAGLLWTLWIVIGPGYDSFNVLKPLFFDISVFSIAPTALVFLFSFIPSLLLRKFYLHQKYFYITMVSFFIFLFLGLLAYQQISIKTCNLNNDEFCLSKKAIEANNPSLCDKAKGNNAKKICNELIERNKNKDFEKLNKNPILNNWKTYKNEEYGFEFKYPADWVKSEMGDFFWRNPAIGALRFDFEETDSKTILVDFVNGFIKEHDCKSLNNPSGIEEGDHVIEKTNNGIYYAEFCTAGTEVYHYATKLNENLILNFNYQDDFESNWAESKKIKTLKEIISTLKTK